MFSLPIKILAFKYVPVVNITASAYNLSPFSSIIPLTVLFSIIKSSTIPSMILKLDVFSKDASMFFGYVTLSA